MVGWMDDIWITLIMIFSQRWVGVAMLDQVACPLGSRNTLTNRTAPNFAD
jgi:hypothetical protein